MGWGGSVRLRLASQPSLMGLELTLPTQIVKKNIPLSIPKDVEGLWRFANRSLYTPCRASIRGKLNISIGFCLT